MFPSTTLPLVALGSFCSAAAALACTPADFEIKSMRARIVDECRRSPCPVLKGVAVLVNRCIEAAGAEVQITAYDKKKQPLATRELWPASTRNIPPGDYTFSLDQWLDVQPGMHSFTLRVVDVKKWR